MEQLESRALGKPKEQLTVERIATDENEEALARLTPEERQALLRAIPDEELEGLEKAP